MSRIIIVVALISCAVFKSNGQVDQNQFGAWYMYFYNTTFKESSWGLQGDIQLRNWNIGGDLEQLLIRSGVTFKPKNTDIKLTLGYGNVTTGAFGQNPSTTTESRIYQEALYPTRIGKRFYFTHRFRFEQRFVQDHDFRTRFRLNVFLNVPLNKPEMTKNTLYIGLYNEVFINGERHIGNGNEVEIFDRNRFYAALGFMINKGMKIQLGVMNQVTDNWKKNQLQLSFHHTL